MLLVIADGVERRLSEDELASVPDQIVYRSGQLKRLTIVGVRVTALLRALFAERRYVTVESVEGGRRTLRWSELETAVLAYRLEQGPLSAEMGGPFRLLVQEGQQLSVSSVKRIVLSDEAAIAA